MSQSSIIKSTQILSRLPGLMVNLPNMIKGIRIANNKDLSKPVGLAMCFDGAVRKNPNGTALIFEDRELTYSELNAWANRISNYLVAKGLTKGDCVAILIENRPELIACVLACAKIGVVCAMLNTAQRGKVLNHSITITDPKMIIVGEECVNAYDDIRSSSSIKPENHLYLANVDTLNGTTHAPRDWLDLAQEITGLSEDNPPLSSPITSEDPCFYIYTSGTTGLPKAVIFNHGRFMKVFGSFGIGAVRLKKDDRMYVPLPFYHATALGVCWSSVLANGACLIMTRKFSASNFWPDIRKYGATSFGYVGELCRYLLDQPESDQDLNNKVRIIVGNGLRASIWNSFKARYGIEKVMEFYGSSEGNIGFTNIFNFNQTVGMSPFPYAIVQYDRDTEQPILDEQSRMIKVKKGQVGLLIGEITPKNPFHGYTDKAKTNSVIFEDVFKSGDRWFNTGDIMRDMGFRHAQFVDRSGDTFRWKGENVSTTEVEMLLEEVDEINESIVYGVEIPNTNGRAGMASLKINGELTEFDFVQLVSQLRDSMPHYAIPVFLRIDPNVALTGTLKHQKAPLKQMAFDVEKNQCPVYVLLPKTDTYIPMDKTIQTKIEQGEYRF